MAPTHDPPTEQALIGALLLNPTLIPAVADIITGDDLADPRHTTIYHTIHTIAPLCPPGPIDPLILAQALAATGNLKHGTLDAAYLHTCLAACTNPLSATHYAHTIRAHATTRTLHTLAARLNQLADLDNPDHRHTQLTNLQHELATTINNTRGLNGRHHNLNPAHLYRIKPMTWLWTNRIPIGTLTLISGREGVGKSIFLAWLAAAITNGNLEGDLHGQARAVLIAAAEDSWEYTITPRLLAAGANLDLVYRVDIAEPDGTNTPINLPHDLHHLTHAVRQVDAAALLLDPLLSVLDDDINVFKAREVRTVLEPLTATAEEARIAIIALAHYNKTRHGDSNSMIANSRAFVEVARTVIAIAHDDDADDYTCVLSQTKNNVGPLNLPSLTYTIDDVTLETDEGPDAHVGRLRWTGEADTTADELLTGTATHRPPSDTGQQLLDYIATCPPPVTVQEVATHFKDEIKYDTVKKTLSRLASRGHLMSPSRGLYALPGAIPKNRGKRTRESGTPHVPTKNLSPVPPAPPSLLNRVVGGGVEGEIEVSPEVSLGTKEVSLWDDEKRTQDPPEKGRDKGTYPPRAHVRAQGDSLDQQGIGQTRQTQDDNTDDEREPWWQR